MLHTGAGGAAAVILTNPHSSDTAVVGFSLAIAVSGKAPAKVKSLGYIASGVFATPVRDSVLYSSPLLDSIALDTALSLVGASTGTLTITPFMIDSLGRQTLGARCRCSSRTSCRPTRFRSSTSRSPRAVEARDTIHVEARDRSGVTWVGYEVRNLPSGTPFFSADSVAVPASTSSVTHTFRMNLPVTTFPTSLQVQAFARNANTRDYARKPVGQYRRDSHGHDHRRRRAHHAARGWWTRRRRALSPADQQHLSQQHRAERARRLQSRRLDVPHADSGRLASVGSRGVAARSRRNHGRHAARGQLRRYADQLRQHEHAARRSLAIRCRCCSHQSVTSTTGSNGVLTETITDYVFSAIVRSTSRRPAQGSLVPGSPCGNVVLVYSTTPTAGQSIAVHEPGHGSLGESADPPVALLLRAGDGAVRSTRRTRSGRSASRAGRRLERLAIVPFRRVLRQCAAIRHARTTRS